MSTWITDFTEKLLRDLKYDFLYINSLLSGVKMNPPKYIRQIRALVILSVCMALCSGCATSPMATPTANPNGQTLIESDPPGARIEINNQYVGTTPLRVDIPRRSDFNWDSMEWDTISVKIIAYPIFHGQQVQVKYIGYDEPTPTHVFFDMNLVSMENSIDVNINN